MTSTCLTCGAPVLRGPGALYCSPECRQRGRDRRRYANRTPEQRDRDREQDRARYAARTVEQRERDKEQDRLRYAGRSEEQRAADRVRWQTRERSRTASSITLKPFAVWDGEGRGNRYVLLANSEGRYCLNADGLTTSQCLEFLLSADPRGQAANVFFSFSYDVANMLRNLSRGELSQLWTEGWTTYREFEIRYAPRRFLGVSWRNQYATYREFHDVFSLFGTSFLEVIDTWYPDMNWGELKLLREGKAARANFARWDMDRVAAYNQVECKALVVVMERVRRVAVDNDLRTRSWYSGGPMAAGILANAGAASRVGTIPPRMEEAVSSAYFGGRIESAAVGRSECYHYDLVSAYPAAYSRLPDLSQLTWTYEDTGRWPILDDGLYDVSWDVPTERFPEWYPLPYRRADQVVIYPQAGRGWYWGVELLAAMRAYGGEHFAVTAAWIASGERDYFLAPTVSALAAKRLTYKAAGDPGAKLLKLALNSISGKFAQRVITRDSPVPDGLGRWLNEPMRTPYRSLIWAGLVTAYTRARLLAGMAATGRNVLSVMTDSLYSTEPLPESMLGSGLGEWEQDTRCRAITLVEPGVYTLYGEAGEMIRSRSRGFVGPDPHDWWPVVQRWLAGDGTPELIVSHEAVTIGMALYQPEYAKKIGRFVDTSREIPSPIEAMPMAKRLPGELTGVRDGDLFYLSSNSDTRAHLEDTSERSWPYVPGAFRHDDMEQGREITEE